MGIWIPVIIPIPHEWLCFPSRPWHLKAAVFGQKAHNFAINISCKPVANTRPNKLLDAAGETCQGIGLGEHIISTWNIWGLYTVRSETCCEVLVDFVLEGVQEFFLKQIYHKKHGLETKKAPLRRVCRYLMKQKLWDWFRKIELVVDQGGGQVCLFSSTWEKSTSMSERFWKPVEFVQYSRHRAVQSILRHSLCFFIGCPQNGIILLRWPSPWLIPLLAEQHALGDCWCGHDMGCLDMCN